MSDMYEMFWVILAIIGIVAVCKVTYQVYQSRSNNTEDHSIGDVAPRPSNPSRSQDETGTMVYYADNPHGLNDCEYRFNYRYVYDTNLEARTWRAYILRMPSLCGRSSDGHVIHRWSDNNGNHWFCWDSPVGSLKDMQSISRFWANNVQEYIATGKRFG